MPWVYAISIWKLKSGGNLFSIFYDNKQNSLCSPETVVGSLAEPVLAWMARRKKMERKQSSAAFGDALQLSENKKAETILECIWNEQDGCSLKDRFHLRLEKNSRVKTMERSVSLELNAKACTFNIFDLLGLINLKFRFSVMDIFVKNSYVFVKRWCWSLVLRCLAAVFIYLLGTGSTRDGLPINSHKQGNVEHSPAVNRRASFSLSPLPEDMVGLGGRSSLGLPSLIN